MSCFVTECLNPLGNTLFRSKIIESGNYLNVSAGMSNIRIYRKIPRFYIYSKKNQLECNSLRKIDGNVTVYLVYTYTGKCVYCTYYAACALEVNPNSVMRSSK